jgi:steroid delta-isomerase
VDVVDRYVRAMAAHDVAAVMVLFADDAVHEEPAGTPPRIGLEQIREFMTDNATVDFDLRAAGPVAVVGHRAGVTLEVALRVPNGELRFAAVDTFELDASGRIARFTAYPDLEAQFDPA